MEAFNKINRDFISFLPPKVPDRNICIQLCQPWKSCCSAGFSNVLSTKEKLTKGYNQIRVRIQITCLRAQILDGYRLRVKNSDRFDSGQSNIFGLIETVSLLSLKCMNLNHRFRRLSFESPQSGHQMWPSSSWLESKSFKTQASIVMNLINLHDRAHIYGQLRLA